MKNKHRPIRIMDSHSPVDIQDIARFERIVGFSLPDDYRNFLLSHNGGRPEDACFVVNDGVAEEELWVDDFSHLDMIHINNSSPDSLTYRLTQFAEATPRGSIVIGTVSRDDLLLLFLDGLRYNQVYILRWDCFTKLTSDADAPITPQIIEQSLLQLSPTFSSFLDSLKPCG